MNWFEKQVLDGNSNLNKAARFILFMVITFLFLMVAFKFIDGSL